MNKATENRTLIAYATKGGATQKIAHKIAQVFASKHQLQTDLVNLQKTPNPDLAAYHNVIVGTGVRRGKIYPDASAFLDTNFQDRRLAYYTCSGFIHPKTYDEVVTAYTTNTLAAHPTFKPAATVAFGGYLKILGYTVNRKMDMARVEAWAVELGKKFQQ